MEELEAVLREPTGKTLEAVRPGDSFSSPSERGYLFDVIVRLATGLTLPRERVQKIAKHLDARWGFNEREIAERPYRRWYEGLSPEERRSIPLPDG